jgi:hypothetical protein
MNIIMNKHKRNHCMNCKKIFLKCLLDLDPDTEEQYKNPLPKGLDTLSPYLIKIHDILMNLSKKDNRGPKGNVLSKAFKPYDYFLPKYNCFVEFDEQQHFTLPRLISLGLYPNDIHLGFDKAKWETLCKDLEKTDRDPPHRDEQRAWLDTIRDLAHVYHSKYYNGLLEIRPTIRFYERELAFCESFHKTKGFIIEKIQLSRNGSEGIKKIRAGCKEQRYKVGMVSFPIYKDDPIKTKKYFKGKKIDIVISLINDNSDLDLLVFPGYTIFNLKDLHTLKSSTTNKKTWVFFEVWDVGKSETKHKAFVIKNGMVFDREMFQYFSTSGEINNKSKDDIKKFLYHLKDSRVFYDEKLLINLRLLICGEQNILQNKQQNKNKAFFRFDPSQWGTEKEKSDNLKLLTIFKEIHEDTNIYINPTHTIMGNQGKLQQRREFFSGKSRVYLTTANYDMKAKEFMTLNGLALKSIQYCVQGGKSIKGEVRQHKKGLYILKTYNLNILN